MKFEQFQIAKEGKKVFNSYMIVTVDVSGVMQSNPKLNQENDYQMGDHVIIFNAKGESMVDVAANKGVSAVYDTINVTFETGEEVCFQVSKDYIDFSNEDKKMYFGLSFSHQIGDEMTEEVLSQKFENAKVQDFFIEFSTEFYADGMLHLAVIEDYEFEEVA